MLIDGLKDIIKHTHGLGFLEMVKVVGTSADAKIEAMDNDKSVVLYGQMYQPIKGLDSTIGMSRLGVLKGYLEYDSFKDDSSTINIITQPKDKNSTEEVPCGIQFENDDGDESTYRFMSEVMVSEQIKVPPFRGAKWNLVLKPTQEALNKLTYFANVHGSIESTFTVSIEKTSLFFNIGQGGNDRTSVKFADGVTGPLKQWTYPLSQVLAILKLSNSSDCSVSFSDIGVMKIDIDSGTGKYEYVIPARQQ